MAITNRERVGKALDLLNEGLRPFVERELKAVHGNKWEEAGMACGQTTYGNLAGPWPQPGGK